LTFDRLLAEAQSDENVLGIVVFGARGKGALVTPESDWDVFVVVRERRDDRPFARGSGLEIVELTLAELRDLPAWNRYSLAWLEPQLDKTGEVAAALRESFESTRRARLSRSTATCSSGTRCLSAPCGSSDSSASRAPATSATSSRSSATPRPSRASTASER
jgi:predicted nucleotidyltransferase